jgi:hypothetical protein
LAAFTQLGTAVWDHSEQRNDEQKTAELKVAI